jgi:signal transduction histidine kinase
VYAELIVAVSPRSGFAILFQLRHDPRIIIDVGNERLLKLINGELMKVTDLNLKGPADRTDPSPPIASGESLEPALRNRLASYLKSRPYDTRTEHSHFLRIAAHDLRNPISGILFGSEYLLENLPDVHDEEQAAILKAIHSSSEVLLDLLDDMMEFCQIEAGTVRFRVQPTDLVSLVRQDLTLNRLIAERKGLHLNLVTDNSAPLVLIDPPNMYQVIDNLVANAIRLSYGDGTIEIRTRVQDNLAILSVRDHGVKIPAEELNISPRPFPEASKKAPSNAVGLSLGLVVVTRIVECHGGHVQMESEAGKGSTFTVSLPISTEATTGSSQRGLRRPAAKESIKVKRAREQECAASK